MSYISFLGGGLSSHCEDREFPSNLDVVPKNLTKVILIQLSTNLWCLISQGCLDQFHLEWYLYHPGILENIAPDGSTGSDIIVVRLLQLDNS